MLNLQNERELAYVVKINDIQPIEGADRVELALINGWRVMVSKGEFKIGDYGVYFEIDSKLPEREPYMFLAKKDFKVKTQKYFKGTVISQGLLMPFSAFVDETGRVPAWLLEVSTLISAGGDPQNFFLTKELGVTYAVEADNARKANSADKYRKMAQRHPKIFKKKPIRWLMRREWGKKILFVFFGKVKDKKNGWPAWVKKTDEERIQNMPWIIEEDNANAHPWIATEKVDGTSTTFTMKRGKYTWSPNEFYVCSRNVVFDKPDKECFYDTNVYLEMAKKYNIEKVLNDILEKNPKYDWVTLQGETFGAGIQKNDYGLTEHCFNGFNYITSTEGKWGTIEAKDLFLSYGVPWVPVVMYPFILPASVDELLEIATDQSVIYPGLREGLVIRSYDGTESFKAVSNEYLLKYHS